MKNIGILKSKLEAFSTTISYLPKTKLNGKEIIITNNNTNNNTNINTNNLEVIFKQAKENIKKDESLSEEEIKEILEKIDEIEEVSKLDETRNKKWFKLRNLMNWLGTKGVNIAINILPLITEILKSND